LGAAIPKSDVGSGGCGWLVGEVCSSGWGIRNSTPQCGQSTLRPASSASAFNFWPHDGQKNRKSIFFGSLCMDFMEQLQDSKG